MRSQAEKVAAFRALHQRPGAFIMPNPWDAGTAKLLASLGFEALATTSLGLANALGRIDGTNAISRDELLATFEPTGLHPGDYVLRVALTNRASGQTEASSKRSRPRVGFPPGRCARSATCC